MNGRLHRYENTIAGQFYGHAHSEESILFYDEIDRTRPVSMVCFELTYTYRSALLTSIRSGIRRTIDHDILLLESRFPSIPGRWRLHR